MIDVTIPEAPLGYLHFRAGALLAQEEHPEYAVCMRCGVMAHLYPADRAYGSGHCYSEDGAREFRISKHCEWCFDNIMVDDEDPDEAALAAPIREAEREAEQ